MQTAFHSWSVLVHSCSCCLSGTVCSPEWNRELVNDINYGSDFTTLTRKAAQRAGARPDHYTHERNCITPAEVAQTEASNDGKYFGFARFR